MNALAKLENATKMLAEVRDAHDAKNLMEMSTRAGVISHLLRRAA